MSFIRNINKDLDEWLLDKARKPLIIRGARQVGKTSLIKSWASKKSKNLVYINLDNARERVLFKSIEQEIVGIDLNDCLRLIENHYIQNDANINESLIFIDEIQNVPSLIQLMRAFYEQRPDLHVIAAGSYLEAKLKKITKDPNLDFTFPVGRIDSLYLYPLDFFEFLNALGKTRLLNNLKSIDWNNLPTEDIHIEATEQFEQYYFYGGMPEIVNALNEGYNKNRFSQIYSGLINGYNDDLHKFELRNSSIKYLEHILMHAPKYAGHSVNYAGFGDSGYGSRELAQAFSVLESVMLLTLARASSGEALPWIGQEKKQKKLIFLDIGLANYISGLQIDQIMRKDLNEPYRGKSAEQVVGQQLLSDQRYNRGNLHYWVKDYREGGAEVDFCTNVNGYPVGIEVKSGSAGSLKSLFEFSKKVPDSKLLRIYSGKMIQSIHSGISVKSIPFYLLPRYGELV